MRRLALISTLVTLVMVAAGCGGGRHKTASPTTTNASVSTSAPQAPTVTSRAPGGPGALQAEANSAAAGDIPDNQVFLIFRNGGAGYSIKYPEGWAQRGPDHTVVFRDKNNIVRIVVDAGPAPTSATLQRELARLKGVRVLEVARVVSLAGRRALKVVYSTESLPNPVTGKRVTLIVDRYYLWRAGRRAVVDLGTPKGVDNVDAYRMMIESFRWR